MDHMTQWTALQGQVVDGLFLLGKCLGSTPDRAVFLTAGGQPGLPPSAIKLIRAGGLDADHQVSVWDRVSKLTHPNLMRLHHWGKCEIHGEPMLYVVTDRAEEVLSGVLKERALTEQETTEMVAAVVDVLAYLHSEGYVHGTVKPANIFAIDDRLRISAESITSAGHTTTGLHEASPYDAPEVASGQKTPAADSWSLGWTIVEALTQQPPGRSSLTARPPSPFEEIVRQCRQPDLARRWSMNQIAACLRGEPVQKPAGASPLLRYAIPAAGAVVVAALWAWPKIGRQSPQESTPLQTSAPPAVAPDTGTDRPSPMPSSGDTATQRAVGSREREAPKLPPPPVTGTEDVALPDVPAKAQRTVQGSFRVEVGVILGSDGRVKEADLKSRGPSRYFANLALEAARRSRFPAGEDGRRRVIEYEFTRRGARVTSVR
jgi:serine/threonine protein kinase